MSPVVQRIKTTPTILKLVVLGFYVCSILILSAKAAEFWVSPDGNDNDPGTREKPLASVTTALREARELRRLKNPSVNDGVKIILRGGIYRLTSPLLFHPADSGTETSPTVIEAATNESPILSGGVLVERWKKTRGKISSLPKAAQGKVWVADAPKFGGRILEIRQLWVNDLKAVRARTPKSDTLARLLAWDRKKQEAWIPLAALGAVRDPAQLEMVIQQIWEIAVLRVKSLRIEGDKACVTFQQPESKIEFEHPWPQPVMSTNGNAPFFLVNRMEFLDQPGEWFQEMPGGKIFYWPRSDEDMTRTSAVAPALETLVQIAGSLDRPVEHLQFKGISFQHTTWLRPAQAGHVPLQDGMFLLDAYKLNPPGTPDKKGLENQAWIGRPPAGISVSSANHVQFERCRFEHLAAAGLDFANGTHDDLVEGCVFHDLGGNGLQLGEFQTGGIETHLPFNPTDERLICSREKISNNLFTDCANEDWGCVGICVGYARGVAIAHNEVSQLPYTGISVGWGWTKTTNCLRDNFIHANHVHHIGQRLTDLGGIYTLSSQPGTVVSENSIHDIHPSPYVNDPAHWFYLYLDEGSSFITVRDNWCPAEIFLKNANGPGNEWMNNGPQVSEKIKSAAGLEPAFQDLLLNK
jgi:hypothetical protein